MSISRSHRDTMTATDRTIDPSPYDGSMPETLGRLMMLEATIGAIYDAMGDRVKHAVRKNFEANMDSCNLAKTSLTDDLKRENIEKVMNGLRQSYAMIAEGHPYQP